MVVKEDAKIGVVLNAYKRTNYLEAQLDAIENQTIKPHAIYVWQNAGAEIPSHLKSRFILAECSENLGVWARFAFALNIDSDYICIFDDDSIPGNRWFENCLTTLNSHDGLLGARGVKFFSPKRYYPFESYGWSDPNEQTVQVDIVGHVWFFKREYLSYFWSELPPKDASKLAGEDIHFSYMLQKQGINTYVPPHPLNEINLWGSLPKYGNIIGADANAISQDPKALSRFDKALQFYVSKGFHLCLTPIERLQKGIVIGPGIRTNYTLKRFVNKFPLLKIIAKYVIRLIEKIGIHI